MNWLLFDELKTKQQMLDSVILDNHDLHGVVLVQDKIVSLEVELSEFANEVRFFKFWSKKKMNRKRALMEFVDCLHFFLSIANDMNLTVEYDSTLDDFEQGNMKTMYLRCKKHVLNLPTSGYMAMTYQLAFCWFWAMGREIGFTEVEILEKYNEKMKINFDRQATGY